MPPEQPTQLLFHRCLLLHSVLSSVVRGKLYAYLLEGDILMQSTLSRSGDLLGAMRPIWAQVPLFSTTGIVRDLCWSH